MTMDYESKAPAEIWATVNAAGFVHIMDDRQQAEDTAEDWNNLADEGYTEHAGTRVICYVPARSSGHRPAGDEAAPIGLRAHLDAAFSLASIAAEPDIMDCIGNAIAIMDGDPDPHGDTESQSVARETSTVDGVIYAQHPGSTGDANYRNDGSTAAQTTECKSVDHSGLLSGLLAVIHRDGGHREHAVGTEQAVREAMDIVPRLLGASDDAECRSAFVADVSRQLRNALAVGSWDMVEQLLADIEPTDCGSVAGKEEGNGE